MVLRPGIGVSGSSGSTSPAMSRNLASVTPSDTGMASEILRIKGFSASITMATMSSAAGIHAGCVCTSGPSA